VPLSHVRRRRLSFGRRVERRGGRHAEREALPRDEKGREARADGDDKRRLSRLTGGQAYGQAFLAPTARRKVGLLLGRHGDHTKAYDPTANRTTIRRAKDSLRGGIHVQDRSFSSRARSARSLAYRWGPPGEGQAKCSKAWENAPVQKLAAAGPIQCPAGTLEKPGRLPEAIEPTVVYTEISETTGRRDALYRSHVRGQRSSEGSYDGDQQECTRSLRGFLARYRTAESGARPGENKIPRRLASIRHLVSPSFRKAKKFKDAVIT